MRFGARQSIKLLRSQKAGVLIGSLLLIMGFVALVHAAKVTLDERGAKHWVPYNAQIERAAVTTHVNDKGGKSYTLDVAYNFNWDGTRFEGSRYRLHDKSSPNIKDTQDVLLDLLTSKEDGGQYPIFVNPKNPSQSAIINEVHPKAKSGSLFLGILFSLMGYFTVFKPKLFGKRSE